jgi:hypothetical protein
MSSKTADKKKKPSAEAKTADVSSSLVARKSFVICQNDYLRTIQPGDDLSDVPERFIPNLKTEGVLETKEGE